MNIKEAKEVIIHAVQAYLDKDETGAYTIPPERQRPLLLMGPPGIGKTAIMEQVAQECGIGLVSYTITHHTRQSAIGLPFISQKRYGKREYSVTEYTMSEIIASVYDQIETSGVQEGILFLDEINCVSETLAPTMLQFLQYKTFGTHRVPDGFIIVTAGNPPQYNKSVRDFDIVTLDRLRRIDIEEDLAAFREYASRVGIHGSIMAYLGIRSNHFYSIRTEVEGRHFVTARGWEDLSRTIQVHEKRSLPVDEGLAVQFLQDPEIARSFAAYSKLPCFDPSSVQEAYDMIGDAFAYSERYHTPVLFRPTTRVCHGYASVTVKDEDEFQHNQPEGFVKDSSKWVIFPRLSYQAHISIEARNVELQHEFSQYPHNILTPEKHAGCKKGIVSHGISET